MTAAPWLAVAAGGAAGSLARYAVGLVLAAGRSAVPAFPLATLAVNTLGGLGIGIVAGLAAARPGFPEAWRLALATGFMGGFTTFSAFSLETLRLLERGLPALAAANVLANLALSLAACAAGLWCARALG